MDVRALACCTSRQSVAPSLVCCVPNARLPLIQRRDSILLSNRFCLIFFLWAVGMTNVSGLVTPERILSDIRRMIRDPLKGASNEDKVDVTLARAQSQRWLAERVFH
jgi:hypothetical protein